jgi:hypothetical protein
MSAGSLKSALDSVENPSLMFVHDHDTTSQIQHVQSFPFYTFVRPTPAHRYQGSYPSFCYFPPKGGGETMRC